MNLIEGIRKIDHSDYVIYIIENMTDELKNEIRDRLSYICHGVDQSKSNFKIYSYRETVKKFVDRCKSEENNLVESRVVGMIGELLVHIILEIDGRFITASPLFNMEEDSLKKGYDVILFDSNGQEIWVTETKSGQKQKKQKTASESAVALINKAKNDLNKRLNNYNTTLWLNALNSVRVYMSNSDNQKDVVIGLLGQLSEDVVDNKFSSTQFNVVLSGVLFNPLTDLIEEEKIKDTYTSIHDAGIFKKECIIAIQKGTYQAVYNFLLSEANNEL